MPSSVTLPCGDRSLRLPVPDGWTVRVAEPPPATPVADVAAAARRALERPLAGPPLRERARGARSVAIAVTDATRPCPDPVLLPALWEELVAAGVDPGRVTVVIGLGMHRATTDAEKAERLGPLAGRVAVVDAQGGRAQDYRALDPLAGGGFPAEVPVHLHRAVVEADLVVATGVVEPHQYAGFSGGRKTVAIGCAGAETIGVLHGLRFLDHEGTRLGRTDGNPMHDALERIAEQAGLAFVLNVAAAPGGGVLDIAAGEPRAVHRSLVERLSATAWTPVGGEPFDAALAGVAAPKDANLYQASRSLTYLAFSPEPVVREGGWLAMAARCPEGAGAGPGEKAFLSLMESESSPDAVVARLRRDGFGAGGQRAYVLARALQRYRGLAVGIDDPAVARACHLETASDGAAAVARLREHLGESARVLVVPHGLATLPVRRDPS